MEKGKIKTTN